MISFNGFSYLNSLAALKTFHRSPEARLRQLSLFLDQMGNPQDKVQTIHVAGSKGKGSTCHYLASILQHRGYKVALFSSPHVFNVRERFMVNGQFVDDQYWHDSLHLIKQLTGRFPIEGSRPEPTYFEALTLMAFYLANNLNVDYLILETGIGGRLDATNLCRPMATIITPIEFEHTELLGDNLAQIASEKAGIIKPAIPVFCSLQKDIVLKTLKQQADKIDAPFLYIDDYISNFNCNYNKDLYLMYGSFNYREKEIKSSFSLLGEKQVENAALAFLTVNWLLKTDLQLEDAYTLATETVALPLRMQILSRAPLVIVDGAHTYESLKSSINTFFSIVQGKATLIFSCSDDKNIDVLMSLFEPFSQIVMSSLGQRNALTASSNYKKVKKQYPNALYKDDIQLALKRSIKYNEPVLVLGSFYIANALGPLLKEELSNFH